MASAAFKSGTKRSMVGGAAEDAGSSNRGGGGGGHRRSRSLSRYSGRFPPPPPESDDFPSSRARFVNKAGFPELIHDDLAYKPFKSKEEEGEEVRPAVGRSGHRVGGVGYRTETDSFRRRGRSVSRHHNRATEERNGILGNSGGSKGVSERRYRRQRSVSVARYQYSDSEGHSSTRTDDEAWTSCRHRSATEKNVQAVYAQRKKENFIEDGKEIRLCEAMRKEVRHAVEQIRMEIEKRMVKTEPSNMFKSEYNLSNGSNNAQATAKIRRNCTTKLKQSEKRMLDLLGELSVEKQHGKELTSLDRELIPVPRQTTGRDNPSCSRGRSNDRTRTSKHLTEEAEKYIEDFLLNVEDTDISSYDGETTETSSIIAGSTKLTDFIMHNNLVETHGSVVGAGSAPVETDGVVLPWLQWETCNDEYPTPSQGKINVSVVPGKKLFPSVKEANGSCDNTNFLSSSLGSWSPVDNCSCSAVLGDIAGSMFGEVESHHSSCSVTRLKGSLFDLDDYVHLQIGEGHLFERFRQKQRIDSGSLILCGRTSI